MNPQPNTEPQVIRLPHLSGIMLQHLVERLVSPELATQWLRAADEVRRRQGHPVNRPLSRKRVAILVRSMKEDEFKPVGDLLRIAHDPEFGDYAVDGQHRLYALIQADVTLPFVIWMNFPKDLFPYLDGRGPRRPADVLAIDGEANVIRLAAMANWVNRFEKKVLDSREPLDSHEIKNMVQRHPQLAYWCNFLSNVKGVKRASIGAALYWLARSNPTRAEVFANALITGEHLSANDPILVLRNRLWENRKEDEGGPTIVMVFNAWDHWLVGNQIRNLNAGAMPRWPQGCPYLMK